MLNGKERGKKRLCCVLQHGVVRNFLYRENHEKPASKARISAYLSEIIARNLPPLEIIFCDVPLPMGR